MIGILMMQLQRSLEGKKYMHEGTCTLLQEAAQVVNSRPSQKVCGQKGTLSAPRNSCWGG
jgi:hypothetical protein